ncbi:MAG: hypothetical protein ACI9EF_003942 [Pseudohongiellaceae bacterium]|jgi:hypothetical protein
MKNPLTLKSIRSMGSLLLAQSKYDEAEPYLREAMEGTRRVLGDDHEDTLTLMHNRGVLLRYHGRFDEGQAEPADESGE